MKRISIIGCCGAGKSTLARELHRITRLPLVHLDQEFWTPGWIQRDAAEFQSRVEQIYRQEAWIIDGHYFSTMADRLARSDTVFHLDYPTSLCLRRVLFRILRGFGRDRADSAPGCPERFDWEFIRYVSTFRSQFRDRTVALLARHPHLVIKTFRHPRELARYLAAEMARDLNS